jgi:hypothetical protein
MRFEWAFLLLGAALLLWAAPAFGDNPEVKEGAKLPAIELPATNVGAALPDQKDAKSLNLGEFKGKKNVV